MAEDILLAGSLLLVMCGMLLISWHPTLGLILIIISGYLTVTLYDSQYTGESSIEFGVKGTGWTFQHVHTLHRDVEYIIPSATETMVFDFLPDKPINDDFYHLFEDKA